MGRILVFTGKGGVGKTSVAAAHARHSALEGKRTLIVSTDMAHNLGDIFGMVMGKTVCRVDENLDALEIDPNYILEHEFTEIRKAIADMIDSGGMMRENLEQMSLFPGMAELLSLLKIMDIYEKDAYDRIIVDCAPTGETLALLKFPELMSWYMEKMFPVGKVAVRVLSPVSKAVFKIQLPNRRALTDVEMLYAKLIQLQALLKDKSVTSVRLVAMPEKMVVEETKRNFMYLNLYDYHVDGVFINRILPKDMDNPFFNEWILIQNKYIRELEDLFAGLPIYRIPWFETDLDGMEGVDKLRRAVLEGGDVFAVRDDLHGETYEKTETGYQMRLFLPCIDKGEVDLHESETYVIVKIGNFKRNIPKPSTLMNCRITGARLEEGTLNIAFQERYAEKEGVEHDR